MGDMNHRFVIHLVGGTENIYLDMQVKLKQPPLVRLNPFNKKPLQLCVEFFIVFNDSKCEFIQCD